MTPFQRRVALERAVRDDPLGQWNQPDSDTVLYGGHSTGCGHVEWQRVVRLWTGKPVTVNEISAAAGYTRQQLEAGEGLTALQERRIIAHYRLPYTGPQYHGYYHGITDAVRRLGPVLLSVGYAWYPQWAAIGNPRPPHYSGGLPNGRPNGFAIAGGRTDLGFRDGHKVTVIGARWRPDFRQYRYRLTDPDHGSRARPEIPPFDIIREGQFALLVNSGKAQFGAVVAYLPDRPWEGIGK